VCVCFLQSLSTAISEIAVVAALIFGVTVSGFMGGYNPSNSKYFNQRDRYFVGYMVSLTCFLCNMTTSVVFRMATSLLTRESDMLVFISYTRRLHMLNLFMFMIAIIIALIYGLAAADDSLFNGDKCIEDETHGSLGFLTWWMEWALNDYPRGAGAFHEKNVTIINPWAQKATALNISRPSKLDVPQYWSGTDEGGGGWGILGLWRWSGVAMFNFLEPQDKAPRRATAGGGPQGAALVSCRVPLTKPPASVTCNGRW